MELAMWLCVIHENRTIPIMRLNTVEISEILDALGCTLLGHTALYARLRDTINHEEGHRQMVRTATISDVPAALDILRQHKGVWGFLPRAALERSAQAGELLVAVKSGVVVGMLDYHRRRDGIVTVYHIGVDSQHWRLGIGSALISALIERELCSQSRTIRLKCPTDEPANQFYQRFGFHKAGRADGGRRALWIWEYNLITPAEARDA